MCPQSHTAAMVLPQLLQPIQSQASGCCSYPSLDGEIRAHGSWEQLKRRQCAPTIPLCPSPPSSHTSFTTNDTCNRAAAFPAVLPHVGPSLVAHRCSSTSRSCRQSRTLARNPAEQKSCFCTGFMYCCSAGNYSTSQNTYGDKLGELQGLQDCKKDASTMH